jgi:Na+-translocating ferredoxin:NAD+ oxidoreductase subunit G
MKDMIKIAMSLTVVCIAAALILGAVFAKTEHARKDIEEKERAETIEGLLGFGHGKKVPSDLKIYPVYRYVIKDDKGAILLGYLLPLKDKGQVLAEIDLAGKVVKVIPVEGDPIQLADRGIRDKAVGSALPKGSDATYAETMNVANLGDKRLGYVIPGVTQGFKTFVKLMVSLNPELTVTGVAITESEEDPGLGAEIQQDYFKNQFIGKTQDILKELKVVKEPLPADYLPVLEPGRGQKDGLTAEQTKEIKQKHLKDDIYALTGATISSVAVTRGVKDTVRKFAYRLGILDEAIKQEKIQVAF